MAFWIGGRLPGVVAHRGSTAAEMMRWKILVTKNNPDSLKNKLQSTSSFVDRDKAPTCIKIRLETELKDRLRQTIDHVMATSGEKLQLRKRLLRLIASNNLNCLQSSLTRF